MAFREKYRDVMRRKYKGKGATKYGVAEWNTGYRFIVNIM
jgi:hypothetical protein